MGLWGKSSLDKVTFDSLVFKDMLGSFSAFPILWERAGRGAKRSEISASGISIQYIQSTFDT